MGHLREGESCGVGGQCVILSSLQVAYRGQIVHCNLVSFHPAAAPGFLKRGEI